MLTKQQLKDKAAEMRNEMGGTIFAFPIAEEDPFSKYAVVMYAGGKYHVYPQCEDIRTAAEGVATILEELKEAGEDHDFKRNARFVVYEAQKNAPDVTMRRLMKHNGYN